MTITITTTIFITPPPLDIVVSSGMYNTLVSVHSFAISYAIILIYVSEHVYFPTTFNIYYHV